MKTWQSKGEYRRIINLGTKCRSQPRLPFQACMQLPDRQMHTGLASRPRWGWRPPTVLRKWNICSRPSLWRDRICPVSNDLVFVKYRSLTYIHLGDSTHKSRMHYYLNDYLRTVHKGICQSRLISRKGAMVSIIQELDGPHSTLETVGPTTACRL